jgi:Ulp1 family protease
MDPLSSFDFMEWTRTRCTAALAKLKRKFLSMASRNRVGISNDYHYTRWMPVENILELDYIFMPIKLEDAHFVLGFVNILSKRTYIFDSLGIERKKLSYCLCQLMKELTMGDNDGWSWVRNSYGPKQTNGCDCGLYVCIISNFLSIGLGTSDIVNTKANEYRERVAIDIYEGKVT